MIAVIILIGLHLIGLGIHIAMHGQPRTGNYNAFTYLVAAILTLALYYWAGLFDCFKC
jgi:xanthine/uracil permease